ncbi:MAG TPA: pitrilysin family protein [Bacteroidales bacterium]|nr:pitrilysin family protein [Bacteroidales bacterium]HPT12732.1 pitrilysin family protein [Bacteroidales bacterium]
MSTLNRKTQPHTITPSAGIIPEPVKIMLNKDVPVYLVGTGTEDLLRIEFVFDAGQVQEKLQMTASTTNEMLTEGTSLHEAIGLNEAIDYTGAVFTPVVDKDKAGIVIITLLRTIDRVLELAAEVLYSPSFPENEFVMQIDRKYQQYLTNRQKTSVVSREIFYNSLFGESPYGRITTPDDFRAISTSTLKDFHSKYYNSGSLYITVAGKDPERALPSLEKYFSGHLTDKTNGQTGRLCSDRIKIGRHFSEVPESVQSSIRIGWKGIEKNHPDYNGLQVANTILGGYFGSRLMKNIREEKGYTYGIGSIAGSLKYGSFISVITDVANQYREETIKEITKEINKLRKREASADEMMLVRNHMMGDLARAFDGPFAMAEALRGVLDSGLSMDYYRKLEETVKTITPEKIKELFNTYYNPDEAIIVIAGAK